MVKKKILVNFCLLLVLVGLVILAVVFWKNEEKRNADNQSENEVELTKIEYGSSVSQIGHSNVNDIINSFIDAYNNHSGSDLVSIMDLVATYIYSDCENPKEEFDDKYVECLTSDTDSDKSKIILLQYSVKQQEDSLIESIDESNVELTLVDNTEIEDLSKYLSTFTANIRTVSADEGIDEVDNIKFTLLHEGSSYYIIDYRLNDDAQVSSVE